MLALHRRLAEIGLQATAGYGFVLAGGYALSANGLGDRPSVDVDLFTNIPDPDRFAEATQRLRAGLLDSGLLVDELRVRPTFVDLRVSDPLTGECSDLQLGLDYRQYPPAQLAIGPVLDVRDAVASKMSALWSRGEARDYIDIDTVVESGRFTREEVLRLGDEVEVTAMDRRVLAARFRQAGRHDPSVHAGYAVDPGRRELIVARFAQWADVIDPPTAGPGGVSGQVAP